ncbi:MAG: Gfo/Idh/MocA family oxidoreductase [Clostridia bacterium]|nr:Gfo/Idh/MocA family oxidoreductase [Clostridia bacterium]
MEKIKVGVFGAGRGTTAINQLLRRGDAEVVAICDKYEPGLEKCREIALKAGAEGISFYTDFDEFEKHDMDAVVLANYANEHAPYAIRLLNGGKHIMSECLTCATMSQAVELIEAVEQSGKIYAYAENYSYTPVRQEMRERYRRGEIGELMYAEGEYVHDCSSIWPQITYGEREHWRNSMYSTFYCTHSIGPILYMTGLRPVKVVGLEGRNRPFMRDLGSAMPCFGLEMITLENGAILKSLHGGFKHNRPHANYEIAGDRGSLRDMAEDGKLAVYREGENENCRGTHSVIQPPHPIADAEASGHGGGDYYTTHYFIEAIKGNPEADDKVIDVYTAVDMCIPGLLAYRSIVQGGVTVDIPNLRNVGERDAYRNDTFCPFKEIAGDMYVLGNTQEQIDIPDSVYDEVRRRWLCGEPG